MERSLAAIALPVLCAVLGCDAPAPVAVDGPVAGWAHYGNDAGGSRHSPLTQITRANVARLEVAWTYRTGDLSPGFGPRRRGKTAFEATPILVGDDLVFCSPLNRVFSVDAETGEERWVFDPGVEAIHGWSRTCRGVAAWTDPRRPRGEACHRRIFTATMDARLFAVDADTGAPCADFRVPDLSAGVGAQQPGEYAVTSPPTPIGDVVAVGSLVWDNARVDMASGVVRAYDARTGALRWNFDPVEPGTPPLPPDAEGRPRYRPGTPNAWSIFSADPERDLLFVPMGSASPDFFGGGRGPADHFANSVVALRGSTGEVVWRFQTVHHDLWDYDVPAQPTLLEIDRDGARVPAVAQPTKMGHVFLLHRESGEPLFPVEERAAPQGDVPGERYAPTQPVPTHPPPLHPHTLSLHDVWGPTPWDAASCRARVARLRNEGIFTPPSLEGSIQYPGVAGGMNWGGLAVDPARRLLVMPMNRVAVVQTLVPRAQYAALAEDRVFGHAPQEGTPYAIRHEILVSPSGAPCMRPPWGTLLAVDLETGAVRWEVPLGTTRNMIPGLPFGLPVALPGAGGAIVTASGLVFVGAALDGSLRAFDVETGEELWSARLPAGAQATPMTYRLRRDGRQFVVIAAGGHASMGPRLADAVVAFALP